MFGTLITFVKDFGIVVALVLAVIGFLLLKAFGGFKGILGYFKTKDGLGALKGIILGPLVIFILGAALAIGGYSLQSVAKWVFDKAIPSASAQELPVPAPQVDTGFYIPGTWFNDATVFLGIDHTKKVSPQCRDGGFDDRSTSNLGMKLNVWESPSKNVRVNAKYTHHSCAINPDNRSYDGVGVEVEWKVWSR